MDQIRLVSYHPTLTYMRLAEYLGWSGVLVLGLEDLIGVGEYVGRLPRGGLKNTIYMRLDQ